MNRGQYKHCCSETYTVRHSDLFPLPLNFGFHRPSLSVAYDVIFSVIARSPKVYPNFLMCHTVYFNNMTRNLGHLAT